MEEKLLFSKKSMKILKKNYEFKKTLNSRKRITGEYIKSYLKPNNKNENALGVAVQTRFGTAVQRNKMKRLVKENYRILEKSIKIKKGYDIVILCNSKEKMLTATFDNIKKDMVKILKLEEE